MKKDYYKKYKGYVKALYEHEKGKEYPDRYPLNEDSIGIEIVGKPTKNKYPKPNEKQLESLKWLTGVLKKEYGLKDSDVYIHPEVSYKNKTECSQCK